MAAKFYAIKKGENLRTGESVNNIIVTSWNECLGYVKGVKGAVYKSFTSEEEAKSYLNSGNALKKGEDKYPEDIPHIYVDGSYNISTEEFGYGVVVILKDEIIYADFGGGKDKQCNQRQVNGELRAAVEGIEHSIEMGYDHVVLFYDYAGVCNHAIGSWERNNELSSQYYEIMQKFMKKIKITFVKVDSHTDDLFNDIADELAKVGAKLAFNSVVDKALGSLKVKVINSKVKEVLNKVVKKNINNISCEDDYAAIDLEIEEKNINDESVCKDEIGELIQYIKELNEAGRLKYIKSLKKDIQTQIILRLIQN